LLPQQCPLPGYLALPLTLLTILGVINAINLSDGLDGLAGGISMLSFMVIGILALNSGNMAVGVMCAAVIGGIAGFLRYNTHPAMLFMGDSGSQLLGFFLGVFAIAVTQSEGPYSKALALPIIGFPILDTLTVMVVRIKNRRSPFSPDKNHFHHQMLKLGFFHTEAVLSIYLIQSCFVIFALVTRFHSEWFHLTGFVGMSAVILGFFVAARKTGWNLRRHSWFDLLVKQRLKSLKERKIFIRVAFGELRFFFFLLLAVQVMIPHQIPLYFSLAALTLILLTGVGYVFKLTWLKSNMMRFSVYMIIPLLVYLSEIGPGDWFRSPWIAVIHLGYFVLVFFVIMTLNLTQRRHGFKISPLDILVFVIILVFPNLPTFYVEEFRIGMMLTKGLILYYSFDVIIGELRESPDTLFIPVLAVLALVTLRGLF
jgi:UDP-GlcNAc:undecaprenyl-phosphate GlcNAc-1-phosphate transferase